MPVKKMFFELDRNWLLHARLNNLTWTKPRANSKTKKKTFHWKRNGKRRMTLFTLLGASWKKRIFLGKWSCHIGERAYHNTTTMEENNVSHIMRVIIMIKCCLWCDCRFDPKDAEKKRSSRKCQIMSQRMKRKVKSWN